MSYLIIQFILCSIQIRKYFRFKQEIGFKHFDYG